MLALVHLSDLHFGFSAERDAYVVRQLEKVQQLQPDHLVISGDLVQSGWEVQFKALAGHLRQRGFSTSARLTVVPGNHDLFAFFFKNFSAAPDLYRRLHKIPKTAAKIRRYGWMHYHQDLARFHDCFDFAFDEIIPCCESEHGFFPFIKILPQGVALVALDSNRLLPQIRGNVFCSNGFVDPVSFSRVLSHPSLANRMKIVVLHHHLLPTAVVRQREGRVFATASRLVNRLELVRILEQQQTDLVLHGHYHRQESYHIGQGVRVLNNGDFLRLSLIRIEGKALDIAPIEWSAPESGGQGG